MTSKFFISRPIFSSVIAIVIVIAGLVASQSLPIAQYPQIAPPTVMISAVYPGASAETLSRTVATPIEEQLNGIEGLAYYSSSASSSGAISITATFDVGTDVDRATQDVNNRVKAAEARLPEEVRRNGVVVMKRSTDILMIAAMYSPDRSRERLFISNYASINIVDELKRLPGIGDVMVFGAQDYSMRIWLKPDRMAQLGVTTSDIASAVRSQNAQNAAGKIGHEPAPAGQSLVYTVTAKGRLLTPEEFGDIIIRTDGAEGVLRVRDVARVELAAYSYDQSATVDGNPSVALGIFLQTGANALEAAALTRARLEELKGRFPEGVDYMIPFDTTQFVSASIDAVVTTLIEAALLVVAVVFLFLQSWRATLIPMVAVPVSLIGTFAGLWLFGFSINTLTLFAMVLAIGIVVDDAIIVLENVERHMRVDRLQPFEAAVTAMREVSGAVVAIVLVLCAVFVPVAFLGGIAGVLYQQFAATVAVAVVISGVTALTLTPALCALILKPGQHEESRLFRPFNRGFEALTRLYTRSVEWVLNHPLIGLSGFVVVIALVAVLFRLVPGSFVPAEDQGVVMSSLMLPDGATLQRTGASGERFRQMIANNPATAHTFVVSGFDLIGGSNKPNGGTLFTTFKHWSERDIGAEALAGQFMGMGMGLSDGMALTFNPPPIRGLGSAGGFEVYLQNRVDGDPMRLHEVTQALIGALQARPEFTRINTFFRPTSPQLFVEVDEARALAMGIALGSIYETLQSTMGALYVNDFNMTGRAYRVQLQAEAEQRMRPEDLGKVHVRSASGEMVPLAAVITVRDVVGPEQVERFNGFVAAKLMGGSVPGISSGEAIAIVEEVAAATLPDGYQLAWTGEAYQQQRSAGSSTPALLFGVVMVFLILAAQYERWSLPLAVILSVPFALLGALAMLFLRGMPNDIYFQIGLVVLIGLAAKNAILIVEFAAQKTAEGMSARAAAIEAARLRFRPIIMTSLAFMFGVAPLAFSSGAGAAARQSMGSGVFGGMLAATFIAILFVPLFFRLLERGGQSAPVGDDKA